MRHKQFLVLTVGEKVSVHPLKRKVSSLMLLPCVFPDRLNETDFTYIRNRPKHGKVEEKHLLQESGMK